MDRLFAILLLVLICVGAVNAGPIEEAKAVFEQYVALEQAFDPAVADLYADDARIKNKRTYPSGQVRELIMPAPQYKQLIRAAMPLAKAKGDYNTYSIISYAEEPPGVRIKAQRFSVLKKYTSPISILIAPGASGQWVIHEELSESRPM